VRFVLLIALALAGGYVGSAMANTPQVMEEPPPWLGVGFANGKMAVRVTEVIRDTPADIAGIAPHDVIVALDGKPVKDGNDLVNSILAHRVGDRVLVSVSRRGRLLKMFTELTGKLDPRELIQRRLVDKEAPPFSLSRMHGKNLGDLGRLRGKVVLLEFWSTSCAQCQETFESLASLEAETFGEVAVLTITPDATPTFNRFLKSYSMPLTVLHDPNSRLKQVYKVEEMGPTIVLIGRDGIVRHADTGPELNLDDLLLEARRAARERTSI
jgi:cytochrome c biogenesis protein CcmG/thiol:disulfide interchange protein DsbE